jgi:26S proteasome regulatory subunit N3
MAPAADVEMATPPGEKPKGETPAKVKPAPAPVDPIEALIGDLRRALALLEKSVASKELRLIARMLRGTGALRKRIDAPLLVRFVRCYVPANYPAREAILAALEAVPGKPAVEAMNVDGEAAKEAAPKVPAGPGPNAAALATPAPSAMPEVSAYLNLLTVLVLLDGKCNEAALPVSEALVDYTASQNLRTLDEISARAFFYYSRAVELSGALSTIRARLLSAYRTSVLRHDAACQAMLLNLLLRNYISYNLYDQADKLISRAPFPETRSNNQLARNLFFTGRIKAIQLDYTEALWNLQQAQRKAPQNSALGFRTIVQKFIVCVQLLTGEIPERSVFRQTNMQDALLPYLEITKAVRVGDLQAFKNVTESCSNVFTRDQTTSLITRLRHNVIKTGLRKISTSYSRISLVDICTRLSLGDVENTEGVVAKAINDGVIDAVIHHEQGFVRSNENLDVYSTTEPTDAFHTRVQFCLNVHNEAVRAMRFPDRDDEATEEQRRERLKEQEELAQSLEEEDALDDDLFD